MPQHPSSDTYHLKLMTELERAKRNDRAFVASYTTTVSKDATTTMHIKNPSDSGHTLDIHMLDISTQFSGFFTVYDAFTTAPSGGDALTPQSMLMDTDADATTSTMEVNKNVTFNPDDYHSTGVFATGGKTSKGGARLDAEHPIVEPGREIVVEVTNTSTDANDASIAATFVESSEVFSDFL